LKNPPEITEQNIQDTLAGLQLQRGRIFRRGLVNLFRSLSGTWARRHKSNSPFKIGRRVVLTRAVTSWYVSRRSEFSDLDRIFHILDRKPPPDHLGDLGTLIGQAKRDVTMLETPYFRVRWFANGNAHVYFLRDDLVTLANKLIAEELGPALGESA
jgi:hypothetical protein